MTGISQAAQRKSLLFIFITMAIDSIGLGLIIPVLPEVLRRFFAEESDVSKWYGFFIAIYAFVQFFSSPFLGSLSDRFGRRPILLIALLGGAMDYFFMAYAPTLLLLFLGRIISGLSGASFTVAGAYIADISTDENRSKNFGVIGAGFGIGFILGPSIGGLLAAHGTHVPFIVAAAFNLLNFLFGYFVLPESLAPENRRALRASAINPFRTIGQVFRMPAIRLLLLVHILFQFAGQTHPSIWTLYTQHRFGWTSTQVGLSLTVVGVLSAISQGGLTGWIVKKLGERTVVTVGCFGEAIGFFLFGCATSGTMLTLVLVFASVFWTMPPVLHSMMSREISANQQGELQGSLMGITSLIGILNPLIVTTLFARTSEPNAEFYMPGSPYFLGACLLFLAWLAALRIPRQKSIISTN